jgi:ABC-type Na+ transport system ATPase subunit NatA
MTTHVCILGIDGSGKSTVAGLLPELISGRTGVRAAVAGDAFRVVDPDQTLLAPGFSPSGCPVTARLANGFKGIAKRMTNHRLLYSVFKILQLACQDAAARRIERRYKPDVVISDGT